MGQRNLTRRQKGAAKGLSDSQIRQISEHILALLREELMLSAERQGLDHLASPKKN